MNLPYCICLAQAIAVTTVMFTCTRAAVADFVGAGSVALSTDSSHHGIAFDGARWHIAKPVSGTFRNYTPGFTFVDETTVAGVLGMRGMTYDPDSGHLFVGDYETGRVREITTQGVEISQFLAFQPGGLNALAYDPRDDSIWLAYFDGTIEKRNSQNIITVSILTTWDWTGLALDPVNNSLLALEDNDTLLEYRTNGTFLGTRLASDVIPNNGQGLAYDATIGRLYVTSQMPGHVTFFDDPSRVPEPACSAIALLGMVLASCRRRSQARATHILGLNRLQEKRRQVGRDRLEFR